jgi:hypothetical protein
MEIWKPAGAEGDQARKRRMFRNIALGAIAVSLIILLINQAISPAEIRETGENKISVTASSEKNADAGAAKAFDGNPESAWIPKSARGGRYESLRFAFSQPVPLSGIRIVNGFAATHKQHGPLYDKYNRIKAVRILLSDNTTYYWMLADRQPEAQTFQFEKPHTTQAVQFFIHSVHKGILYDELAVSEVSFF